MSRRGNQVPTAGFSPVIAMNAHPGAPGSALLEQLFRSGAVGSGVIHVRLDPADFRLESLDTLLELVDRHGVEVLPGKFHQRVTGLAWKEVFLVHGPVRSPCARPESITPPRDKPPLHHEGRGRTAARRRPVTWLDR